MPALHQSPALLYALVTQTNGGWIGRWSPGIGDPSLMGWVTVVLYALCAWQCWRAAQVLRRRTQPVAVREKRLWQGLAIGFLALGINKQLDLQTALTELGRSFALQQGWYERRGEVQFLFVVVVALVALFIAVAVVWSMWGGPRWTNIAIVGTSMVLAFVVMRAASFHHVDRLLSSALLGVRFNWVFEITGIGIVALSGWMRRREAAATPSRRRR